MSEARHEHPSHRAARFVRESGYKTGGDIKVPGKVSKIVRKAVREHEDAQHGGKHETLKLKTGGAVHGKAAASRPDKRARGGKVGSVTINVQAPKGNAGDDQSKQQMAAKAGLQKGVQIGAAMAQHGGAGGPPPPGGPMPPPGGPGGPPPAMAGGMPPHPPMVPPGPGGPPMMPPRKDGGSVPHLTAGAGSALGRLEKAGMVKVKGHTRRRAGGCVE